MSKDIRKVYDLEGLLEYFSSELDWNIDMGYIDDIEDVVYEFDANDLGLKQEAFAKIKSLYQLQPMYNNQPWGIFCIDFDSEKLQVTALRKVLSGLIPKKRNSENHAVWDQKHLLFLCFWGTGDNRTIGVARFEEKPNGGLPEIKIIYCSPAKEEYDQIRVFEDRLSKLRFPSDPSHAIKWLLDWSEAFTTAYRQTIKNSQQLAQCLAVEAKKIHDTIIEILDVETGSGYVHKIYKNFKETLVHDLSESDFADMYAQTIVYGLFSARCMDDTVDNFSAEEAVDCMPITNPFLKNMMQECIKIGNTKTTLSFDELGVSDVVSLLKHTDAREITKDFNRQTGSGKEDPVIHFYEEFLTAYNKEQKVQRGVFYTPQPVVKFMVNAVDDILRNEFGLKDGLASTETKTIKGMVPSKVSKYKLVKGDIEVPAVQILDPATGTGTYLRQIILKISDAFKSNFQGQIFDKGYKYTSDYIDKWSEYVEKHLLDRINAFELMMAPYAVAHMKLAMVLKQTGYDFHSDKRLNVFLTNSLEEPGDDSGQIALETDPLSQESVEANGIKKDKGINIIIGNPPYSGSSSNKGEWIQKLIDDYRKEPNSKERLKEQKTHIDNDYVKFIRLAQNIVEKSDKGIVSYITPRDYLYSPTFRGMRWNLLKNFDTLYIIDLNGDLRQNTNSKIIDENVFDIQQGVSILIFIKNISKNSDLARIYHCELIGNRESKFERLNALSISDIEFEEIKPNAPFYLFKPVNSRISAVNTFSISELFISCVNGIQTGRDILTIQNSKDEIIKVVNDFSQLDTEEARIKYNLGNDGRDWQVWGAQQDIINSVEISCATPILYRPFDIRWTYYTGEKGKGFLQCPRGKIMSNMVNKDNIALVIGRQGQAVGSIEWCLAFVSNGMPTDLNLFYRGGGMVFPLFVFNSIAPNGNQAANIDSKLAKRIADSIDCKYFEISNNSSENHNIVYPKDLLYYIYSVLYSHKYREIFSDLLAIDFPKIPYPKNQDTFWELVKFGKELVELHTSGFIDYHNNISSGIIIEKPKYDSNRIFLNKNDYVENVDEKTWDFFIGGYQPLQKWLKDRKGRVLSEQDIEHYKKMIVAIQKTQEIMAQIDEIIEL